MNLRPSFGLVLLCGALAACSGTPATSTSGSVPTAAPSGGLRTTPRDLGCDSIGWEGEPIRLLTFHVQPGSPQPVWALSDTGLTLPVSWPAGFTMGSDRSVRDPAGSEIVRDGEDVPVPVGANLVIAGYDVCATPSQLYVMLPQQG